uniref:Protein lin-54 n=1 Tax=Sphaerodactylus townsendi TaxID=933632 RepID=A0ACB8E8J6_9SAUR
MEVVSAEVNSLLPEEIMDTGMTLEDDENIEAVIVSSPMGDSIPMETELEEVANISSVRDSTAASSSITAETVTVSSNCMSQVVGNTAIAKIDPGAAPPSSFQSGLQKLGAPTPVTISANQIILNKATDLKIGNQTIKQEGQKLIVTALGKPGQPIVLALPHSQLPPSQKAPSQAQASDSKVPTQQFKVVTIGGRPEVKPVISVSSLTTASQLVSPATQSSVLQTQQLKAVQIAKKTRTPTSAPVITKLIFTKPINSKAVTGQTTQVSPIIAVDTVIKVGASIGNETIVIWAGHPFAQTCLDRKGLRLKRPQTVVTKLLLGCFLLQLTVVSVASQPPNSPQKAVSVPLNVALGQQILTVQHSTPTSPGKAVTNNTTAQQAVKSAVQTLTVGGVNTPQFKTIIPLATASNVQQIQVPGSKFHYVRLVTATTANSSAQPVAQNPSASTASLQQAKPMVVNATPVRMSVPIVPAAQTVKQVAPKPLNTTSQIVTTSQPQQRLIMPATQLPQIQPNLTNLPPGTVLAPAPGTGNMGYAVLPAQYVTQLQQSSYVSIASNTGLSGTSSIQTQARLPFNGIISSESANRPRKPCNCTKSLCLKLYCDCFANGEFCNNCNCTNCYNNLDHENERQKAIKACLDRNPEAFKPKIGKGKEGESDRRHSKGCNCKRSGCLKNYCECYEAKIMCSSICKCIGCKNFEESPERKTLMHLADAAEVRVQQQTAAKTKLSSQISDLLRPAPVLSSGGGKLPFTFVTKEVADATCDCLLAQAEQAEKAGKSKAMVERMILEEFGRCLMRIINTAGKSKSDACAMNC